MKFNKWTVALAAIGVVSLASAVRADEQMNTVQTALSSTTLRGYVDTAAIWRPGTDTGPLPPTSGAPNIPNYNFSKNDGFFLNAVDMALDKPEDETPWAAGYHAELMLGPDAVPAPGIRQAYLTLRLPVGNGIDWKAGVWDAIIGYESSSDPLNPNYTRSYGYSIEPATQTGVLATYQVDDMITVQAGVADSFNGINAPGVFESQKAYMGDIQLTAPEGAGWLKTATLTVGVIDAAANQSVATPGSTSFYAGATLPTPVKALKVGAAFDYLDLHNGGVAGNPSNDSVWDVALYSSYQATEKLAFNLRAEYLSNDGGLTSMDYSNPTVDPNYGVAEEFTATARYDLWANVISRVEFRWDHVEHGDSFGYDSATGTVFRANDFMLALNLIYQF